MARILELVAECQQTRKKLVYEIVGPGSGLVGAVLSILACVLDIWESWGTLAGKTEARGGRGGSPRWRGALSRDSCHMRMRLNISASWEYCKCLRETSEIMDFHFWEFRHPLRHRHRFGRNLVDIVDI